MDRTVRFWHGVMGAPLVATDDFRQYFFDFGGSCVAFFEYHRLDAETVAKPAGVPDTRFVQFDHLSLNLPDEAAVDELKTRLEASGTEIFKGDLKPVATLLVDGPTTNVGDIWTTAGVDA
jgi:catechol 2,3-dioxygenase-like lactoylglutathione lyase family enzyme